MFLQQQKREAAPAQNSRASICVRPDILNWYTSSIIEKHMNNEDEVVARKQCEQLFKNVLALDVEYFSAFINDIDVVCDDLFGTYFYRPCISSDKTEREVYRDTEHKKEPAIA